MECYHERAFYYWRHGYYGHVQFICSDALTKVNNDLFLHIWKSLSLGILGQTEDALKEISEIEFRDDLLLLLLITQYCIIKSGSNINHQKVKELQSEIKKQVKISNQFCISQSAQTAFMFNNIKLANQILSYAKEPMPISGWIQLIAGDMSSAEHIFDSILNTDPNNLFSLYGKYIIYLTTSKNSESLEIYGKIVGRYNFPELNVEKARNSARYGNYDQAVTILHEYQHLLPTTIEYDIFSALNSIIKKADIISTNKHLIRIFHICEQHERNNWKLTSKISLVFGTLSRQNLTLINQTIRISQLAYDSNPTSPLCAQISAYHHIITHNFGVAQSILKSIDYNNIEYTNLNSQFILMKTFHQDKELEDSLDLNEKIGNTFSISTFRSYLARKKNQDASQYIPLILDEIKTVLNSIHDQQFINQNNSTPLEIQYERFLDLFAYLRLDIIFDSFEEIVVLNNTIRNPIIGKLSDEVESYILSLSYPLHGYIPLIFVLAVLSFRQRRYYESEYLFQTILISKWKYRVSECLVYLAQIDIKKRKESLAKIKINEAFSLNDHLKEDYNFHLIRTEIFKDQKHLHALIPFFQNSNRPITATLEFLDLAISMNSFDVAIQIYNLIKPKAIGLIEKGSLALRKAKIVAGYKLFEKAFEILEKLKKHPEFVDKSTVIESEIRFKYKIGSFIDCLKKLQNDNPSSVHCEMIGDGYIKIFDFLNAAKWYKLSFDFSTPNPDTFQKYISALMSAHCFDEAVLTFTENYSKIKNNFFILIFLLKKLIRIERYKEAQKCINTGINLINKTNIIAEADFYCQCGIVSWKLDDIKSARKFFKKASHIYDGIFMDVSFQNAYIDELRAKASFFFIRYARFCTAQQMPEKAIDLFTRAIELDESNSEPVLELVKFYKGRYAVQKCVVLCTEFLKRYPNNEKVALELTTLETLDYSNSIKCLIRVLKAHPNFYSILIRLIEICLRAGKLNIVAKRITKDTAPGMIFANALYLKYTSRYIEAIELFQKIENDHVWGNSAKLEIIKILINPERKYIWCTDGPLTNEEDLIRASAMIDAMSKPKKSNKKMSVKEVNFDIDPINKVILQAEIESSRNTTTSVSSAASLYSSLLDIQKEPEMDQNRNINTDQNQANSNATTNTINNTANNPNSNFIMNKIQRIAGLVGLARCEIRLGNNRSAERLISEVIELKPYHETYSLFEEAYLIRGHLYLIENNFGPAQHFFFMAISVNMSCKKGWEMSAILYKRNKMYAEAANAYLYCWKLSCNKDLDYGYEYALCSMKANKPEDAIEMCRIINEIQPLYRNMKQNIMLPSFRKLKV